MLFFYDPVGVRGDIGTGVAVHGVQHAIRVEIVSCGLELWGGILNRFAGDVQSLDKDASVCVLNYIEFRCAFGKSREVGTEYLGVFFRACGWIHCLCNICAPVSLCCVSDNWDSRQVQV